MNDSEAMRRLRWKCRRGMLELDLILEGFVEGGYTSLSEQQRETFDRLLAQDDPVLHSWFMRQSVPEDKELAAMVEYVLINRDSDDKGDENAPIR